MKKILALMLALMLVLSLAACGGSDSTGTTGATTLGADSTTEAPVSNGNVLGDGATSFDFVVVAPDGSETTYEIHTDASTVGEALVALGLIEGSESEYGLYVTTVNGITADWEADNAYWAFYIDGEYALTGVDSTEVTAGAAYSFVYTGSTDEPSVDVTVLGDGATAFNFTVVDLDGNETQYQIQTDETTVGAALLAVELIAGSDSEYGLYVTTVNGVTADWEKDGTYWAFYIDGEYALTGVDSTEVTADATYSFVLTKG